MSTLLLTRPQESAEDFATAAAWAGSVVISPVLDVRLRPIAVPAPHEGLVFTSQHGVRAVTQVTARRDWPVWCVGPGTEAAARAAGFANPQPGGGNAQTLIARLCAAPPSVPLVHVRGAHAVTDLASRLTAAGLRARSIVAYDQIAQPLSDAAKRCLCGDGAVVLPVFSPRSARILATELARLGTMRSTLHALAISEAVARELRVLPLCNLLTAPTPDQPGMLEVLMQMQAMLEPDWNPR